MCDSEYNGAHFVDIFKGNVMIQIKDKLTNQIILNLELDSLNCQDLRGICFKNANLHGADLSNANLSNADLKCTNLIGTDLSYANLNNADLSDADLSNANLHNANLRNADLSNADLSNADLSYANLNNANLNNVNLINAIGNMREICSMQLDKWEIVFTKDILAIGCQQHKIEQWANFDDDRIHEMHSDALIWWKKWKDLIFLAIQLKYQTHY